MAQMRAAFAEARATKGAPTAIIAETVKGKGVSFMENQVGWHGKAPNDEQYEQRHGRACRQRREGGLGWQT